LPGTYVNAEANADGLPLWLTTGAYETLRNNDTRYTVAWEPYFSKLSQIISEHLITNGGNVIIYQVRSDIDPVRGAFAEGGLCAERLGWHLPGYNDSHWNDTTSP
jgi:hypothetical protein